MQPSDELYRMQSEEAHRDVLRYFSNACRDDATFAACLSIFTRRGYYRRFFEPIKQRWVEHPTLLAYITCEEPFQGLKTTPAIAGLRVKLQPKAKDTYELLRDILKEESGLDLDKEIAEEQRRANDRLALGTVGGHGRNQHTGGVRNTKSSTDTRSYIVARLDREAGRDPPDLKAAMLRDQVLAGTISAHAAALAMGWRKPPNPGRQLEKAWAAATPEQRAAVIATAAPVATPDRLERRQRRDATETERAAIQGIIREPDIDLHPAQDQQAALHPTTLPSETRPYRTVPIPLEVERAAAYLRQHLTPDDRARLAALLVGENDRPGPAPSCRRDAARH